MKNRLEGEGSFEHIDKYSDVIKLLNIINSISYSYKSKPHPFLSVHQPMKAFYASYQQTTMSYDSYMEPITNLRDAIVHCGGSMGYHPFLVNKKPNISGVDPTNSNYQQVETTKTESKEAYMLVNFTSIINQNRYGHLMNELQNTFRMERYEYPKTLTRP